jgi:hypothetical protein
MRSNGRVFALCPTYTVAICVLVDREVLAQLRGDDWLFYNTLATVNRSRRASIF